MKLITHLSWLLRALLFLAVFAFALMNTGDVTLRFFLGLTWETLMSRLAASFACGAGIGGPRVPVAPVRAASRIRSSGASCAQLATAPAARRPRPGTHDGAPVAVRVRPVLRAGPRRARRHQAAALGTRQLPRSYSRALTSCSTNSPTRRSRPSSGGEGRPGTTELHFAGELFRRRRDRARDPHAPEPARASQPAGAAAAGDGRAGAGLSPRPGFSTARGRDSSSSKARRTAPRR